MRYLLGSKQQGVRSYRAQSCQAAAVGLRSGGQRALALWGSRLGGGLMIALLMSCSTAFQFARAPSPERVAEQALQAASVPAGVVAPDVEGRLALARRDYAEAATYYELSITRSPKLKEAYLGAASAFSFMGTTARTSISASITVISAKTWPS